MVQWDRHGILMQSKRTAAERDVFPLHKCDVAVEIRNNRRTWNEDEDVS